jgi:hypothetical protein
VNQYQWSSQPGFPGPQRFGRGGLRVGGIAGLIILLIGIIIVIVIVATRVHSVMSVSPNGPCVGGPEQGATGQPIGHGNYRFFCSGGGSTVVHLGG